MNRLAVTLAAFAAFSTLPGCGHVMGRRALDATLSRAVSDEIRPAGSRDGLIAVLKAQEQARKEQADYHLRGYCAAPAGHQDEWACREWRGEPDDHLDRIEVTGSRVSPADVLTNNQEGGVDEGDIVKKRGDRLYVLARGKLHTLDIGDGGLRPVQTMQLATPGEDMPWFDEILAAGNWLVLLAYDPHRQSAQLLVFSLRREGVQRVAHHEIRASDYFTSGNYGARIEGENLLLYLSTPIDASLDGWPAWRPFGDGTWSDLIDPAAVHVPMALNDEVALHAVLRCPLDGLHATLACEARGVIGGLEATFYASASSAWLALAEWDRGALLDPDFHLGWADETASEDWRRTAIYRFPYDAPATVEAARVPGWIDHQFALKDDPGGLLVATRRYAQKAGELRLLRVKPAEFGQVPGEDFETLAVLPVADDWATVRFLHGALWVGVNAEGERATLVRQPVGPAPAEAMPLPHSVASLDAVGDDIVVHGFAKEEWIVSLIDGAAPPRVLDALPVTGYVGAESRSHAFNAGRVDGNWLFGMPAVPSAATFDDDVVSDVMLFRVGGGTLDLLRRIDMQHDVACEMACDDWYGNARLFFIGERVFALSGQRLAELRVSRDEVREVGALLLD